MFRPSPSHPSNDDNAVMERMLQATMSHPSGRRQQTFEQLRRFVHQQRQQHARQLQQIRGSHKELATNSELSENRNGIRLTMDLPGVEPSDVSVSHDHGVLTVNACRKHLSLDNVCVKKQKVQRRYAVNTDVVDTERLTATLKHGVLTLQAPKKKKTDRLQPKGQISVTTQEHTAYEISVASSVNSSRSSMDNKAKPPPLPPDRSAYPTDTNLHCNVIESLESRSD